MPIRAALLAALLSGGATAAALGLGLNVHGLVLATAIVGCGLLGAGFKTVVLRRKKLREANQARSREFGDLVKAREDLLERRNQVSAKRGVAQVRVDSARSNQDQAVATLEPPHVALKKAELRHREAGTELERIKVELAILQSRQPQHDAGTSAEVEAAERAVLLLKEQVSDRRRKLDEARHRRVEAEVRVEAATSATASTDTANLERRMTAARLKVGEEVESDPKEAQTRVRFATQTAAEFGTAVKVAQGRLSDARSRLDRLASTLDQPADQVLDEAEKKLEDADKTLECLDEISSGYGNDSRQTGPLALDHYPPGG
jgi:hypothetical protein